MRTIIFIWVLSVGALCAKGEIKSVFKESPEAGAWGSVNLAYDEVLDHGTMVMGFRGAWMPVDWFALGAFFQTLASDIYREVPGQKQLVDYDAYGALSEFTLFPSNVFHITIPVLIGAGNINIAARLPTEDLPRAQVSMGNFFFLESGLNMEVNITERFRVSLGSQYQQFQNINSAGLKDKDFSGPIFSLGLKWGRF
jgi:hypothetical protein